MTKSHIGEGDDARIWTGGAMQSAPMPAPSTLAGAGDLRWWIAARVRW